MPSLPDFESVQRAAERLRGLAVQTPLLEDPGLSAQLGGRLLIKAECLQRTGSFKFRGAMNRLVQLSDEQRRGGVVAFSSGNHAQGVAAAAAMLDIPAVIVMPRDAPAMKVANTLAYGAEVILYDRWTESREAIGESLSRDRGLVLVPPFDDADIIAGQGTCGIELINQANALGLNIDAIVAPCSGGGLVAGIALAAHALSPRTEVWLAEPTGFDDAGRSLRAGERMSNPADGRTSLCDALMAPSPGILPFAIHRTLVKGGLVADDDAVQNAMALAFDRFKIVVEPGGAVAFAAILSGTIALKDRTVVAVCSGGNVDRAVFAAALAVK